MNFLSRSAAPPTLALTIPPGKIPTHRVSGEILITPSMAAEWLQRNVNNRPQKARHFQYAADMKSGNWVSNGESIKFSASGNLIDGQHRLEACLLADVAFTSLVVFGLPEEAQRTVDIGVARSVGDQLKLVGYGNYNSLGALARMVLIYDTIGMEQYTNTKRHPSKPQAMMAAMQLPDLEQSLRLFLPGLVEAGTVHFCHYVFARQNRELADRFFEEVKTGANLPEDSPTYLFRQRMFINKSSRAKLPKLYVIAIAFKAWKAYRDGKPLKALRWVPESEAFPEI